MKRMQYQEVLPISREEALRVLQGDDREDLLDGLVRIAHYDPDWRWVQEQCLRFASSPDLEIRRLAIICIGHLARIHRKLDFEKVVPVLKELHQDPEVAPTVEDAYSDIRMFMNVDLS